MSPPMSAPSSDARLRCPPGGRGPRSPRDDAPADNWYEDRIQGHEDVPFSERNKVLCEKSSDIAFTDTNKSYSHLQVVRARPARSTALAAASID